MQKSISSLMESEKQAAAIINDARSREFASQPAPGKPLAKKGSGRSHDRESNITFAGGSFFAWLWSGLFLFSFVVIVSYVDAFDLCYRQGRPHA